MNIKHELYEYCFKFGDWSPKLTAVGEKRMLDVVDNAIYDCRLPTADAIYNYQINDCRCHDKRLPN